MSPSPHPSAAPGRGSPRSLGLLAFAIAVLLAVGVVSALSGVGDSGESDVSATATTASRARELTQDRSAGDRATSSTAAGGPTTPSSTAVGQSATTTSTQAGRTTTTASTGASATTTSAMASVGSGLTADAPGQAAVRPARQPRTGGTNLLLPALALLTVAAVLARYTQVATRRP